MSQEDTLRLTAEVVDKFSPELKKFLSALNSIGKGGKDINEQGAKHTREHQKAYKELAEQLRRVKDTAVDTLRPAFDALGVSVLTIAGSIAAVGEAVKSFGEYGQKLEFAHRASGLLTGTVLGLAEASSRFGTSQEETIKSLEEFGAHMDQQKRRSYEWMNAYKQFPTLWNQLGKSLDGLNREDQLKRVMEYVPNIRNADQRKRVLALFGLPENWAYLTAREMSEMKTRADEFNRRFPFNPKIAEEAKKSWDDLLETFRGLKMELSQEFSPGFSKGLRDINGLTDSEQWKSFSDTVKSIGSYFSSWNIGSLKSDIQDVKMIIDAFKAILAPGDKNSWWNRPLFSGPNSLFGGNDKKTEENVKEGVRKGLEDFYHSLSDQNKQGGYTPMAYHPPGSAGGGSSRSNRFGSSEFPLVNGGTGGTSTFDGIKKQIQRGGGGGGGDGSNPMSDGVGAGLGGSEFLRARRQKFADALRANPNLRNQVKGMMVLEGAKDPVPVAESLLNRSDYANKSLDKMLHSGFYGPINRGRLPGAMSRLQGDAKLNARMDKALEDALAGSNTIKGATDQGLPSDPNGRWPGGFINRGHGNIYNDWGGGPGGHAGAQHYREMLQAGVERAAQNHGAKLRDMVHRGGRSPNNAEMLRRGMRGVDAGTLNGHAKVTIDLNGAPRGTRTSTGISGIFKEVTLNRGRPMAPASEVS